MWVASLLAPGNVFEVKVSIHGIAFLSAKASRLAKSTSAQVRAELQWLTCIAVCGFIDQLKILRQISFNIETAEVAVGRVVCCYVFISKVLCTLG